MQIDQATDSNRDTYKKSTGATPLVEVKKTIQASPELVFDAFTKRELIQEWWGPSDFTCPRADVELNVGGKYNFCMYSAEGREIWSGGEFLELEPGRKAVMSCSPTNEQGDTVSWQEAGVDGFTDGGPSYITLEIEAKGDRDTEIRLTHSRVPARLHDECVKGWSSSLEKFKNVVERQ